MPGRESRPRSAPWMACADGLVVRVEDVGVLVVEGAIPGGVLTEDERLEEPGDMGAVPLGRAHVRHRLHGLVLCAQNRRQAFGVRTHSPVGVQEVRRRCSTAHLHEIRPFATPPGAVAQLPARCGSPYPDVVRVRRDHPTFRVRCGYPGGCGLVPGSPPRGHRRTVAQHLGVGPGARPLPVGLTSCPRRVPPGGGGTPRSGGALPERSFRRGPCCGSCAGPERGRARRTPRWRDR